MGEMTDRAGSTAEEMGQQAPRTATGSTARSGSAWSAYGIVHLLIGWLALQLAFGDHEGEPSSKGAMQELAEQPFGEVLIWAIAIGMFFLVIWAAPGGGPRAPRGGRRQALVEAR